MLRKNVSDSTLRSYSTNKFIVNKQGIGRVIIRNLEIERNVSDDLYCLWRN